MTRFAFILALAACATSSSDPADTDAETATADATGKADAASFVGLYHISSSTWHSGDITDLDLFDGGTFVRARCYHASCAEQIPETDKYDVVTSHGRKYLRFYSIDIYTDSSGLNSSPRIADVYEVRAISKGIQLRKTYTSRWFSLFTSSESNECAISGGTFAGTDCTCPGNTPGEWPATIFVAGAGGCIATPGSSEGNCDDSGGMWMDDDGTVIGTYCLCGYGRYNDSTGSCTNI